MKDFKEDCWILYGIRIFNIFIGFKKYHSRGSASEVSFDYDTVSKKSVIGWLHTHPGVKSITPSATDNRTMRSWVKSFYKSYICGIHCNGREAFYKYRLNGVSKKNVTMVKREKMKIEFIGSFFIAF